MQSHDEVKCMSSTYEFSDNSGHNPTCISYCCMASHHHAAIAYCLISKISKASQVALVVKNPPANARDLSDVGSIPGVGRCLKKMETHSSIFGWKIPWIEEPGGLHSP